MSIRARIMSWRTRRLPPHARGAFARRTLVAVAILSAVGFTGCDEQIDVTYGKRAGLMGGDSVNGTAVLARMFENAGHRVRTKRALTNAMRDKCNVIVWAADDFDVPSKEVIAWFDQWLWQDGRTLIVIGRDFDAGTSYYDRVIPGSPTKIKGELQSRRGEALAHARTRRSTVFGTLDCAWYSQDTTTPSRKVTELSGPWSDHIDARQVDIRLRSRVRPKPFVAQYDTTLYEFDEDGSWEALTEMEVEKEDEEEEEEEEEEEQDESEFLTRDDRAVLLRSGEDILVSCQAYDETTHSQIILVANGSFLLNLPLVEKEHRKLAAKLIDQVGEPTTVVFVESGEGGPRILAKEPANDIPSGLALFAKRPLDVILFHFGLLGILFCLSRWPIFGQSRKVPDASPSDFGKHVDALGELLQKTGDHAFASSRLRQYHQASGSEPAEDANPDRSPPKAPPLAEEPEPNEQP